MNAFTAAQKREFNELTGRSKALGIFKAQPEHHILGRAAVALSKCLVGGRSNLMTFANNSEFAHDTVLRHALLSRDPVLRSAVGVIDTGDIGALLAEQTGETLTTLAPLVVLRQINATDADMDADGSMRNYPRLALDSGAAAGWTLEGGAVPVVSGLSDAIQFGPASKCGAIVNLSRELFQRSDAARAIESLLLGACAKAINIASMSNAVAAAPVPAGIFSTTWASAPITSTALAADINALTAALSAYFPMSGASFLMHPTQAAKVANSGAFPSLALSGTLNGAKVVTSVDIPTTRVGLVYDAEILASISVGPENVSVSESASTHSDSVPSTDIGGSTTPVYSTWQLDALSVRVICNAAFAALHPESVVHVEGVAW